MRFDSDCDRANVTLMCTVIPELAGIEVCFWTSKLWGYRWSQGWWSVCNEECWHLCIFLYALLTAEVKPCHSPLLRTAPLQLLQLASHLKYRTHCVSQISSAFQSPTTPFPTTDNLVPHLFPSLIKILKASSVYLLSQKQPSSVASMWLWTQTNNSSREPKKTNKGSNATTNQHPTGT